MTDVRAFKVLSLLTASSVVVVTACTIQLRGEDTPRSSNDEQRTDASSLDLARCRSVTTERAAGYQQCKQVWAENRRRFFGKKDGAVAPDHDESAIGVVSLPKDQSRIPQGYAKPAAPEANKP